MEDQTKSVRSVCLCQQRTIHPRDDIYRPVVIPATIPLTSSNPWTSTKQCSAITPDGMYPTTTLPGRLKWIHLPPDNASATSDQPQHAARIVNRIAETLNKSGPFPLMPDR